MATGLQQNNRVDQALLAAPEGSSAIGEWKTKLARRGAAAAWLFLPLAALWWHYGPGQYHGQRDAAAGFTRQGEAAVEESDWQLAAQKFTLAMDALPTEDVADRRQLEVALASSRIEAGEMIEGQEQLQNLVAELEEDPEADGETLAAARHELATASYYAAWWMRLEGASREEWLPETERARQQFRLLAEESVTDDGDATPTFQENLEATIRLEQMDLATLMALPPPCKCCNCDNLSQKKREQCRSRCRRRGRSQEPEDGREEVQQTRSAGVNEGGSGGS